MPKLTLKHPLTFGKKTVDSLTFRDHTIAADYLAFDYKGGVLQRQHLIANLSGTDISLIQQLHGPDYLAASRLADQLLDADEAEPAETREEALQKKSPESLPESAS
ncbi:MAG: phage tail assembly protein [Azonexus sp.]|jgi:hypothetical protein|nr:phage tail assembly protein [Azonexus sp.]